MPIVDKLDRFAVVTFRLVIVVTEFGEPKETPLIVNELTLRLLAIDTLEKMERDPWIMTLLLKKALPIVDKLERFAVVTFRLAIFVTEFGELKGTPFIVNELTSRFLETAKLEKMERDP